MKQIKFTPLGLCFFNSDGTCTVYDESSFKDWDGSANVSVTKSVALNPISFSEERMLSIEAFAITYKSTLDWNFIMRCDQASYQLVIPSSSSPKYVQKSIKRNFNNRARAFAVDFSSQSDEFSIFGISLTIKHPIYPDRPGGLE
jgi:hypothetical protein